MLGKLALTALAGLTWARADAVQAIKAVHAAPTGEIFTGPLVSVVVPAYNEEAYLPVLLESLSRQSYRDYEVMVVVSGADGTEMLARQWGARVLRVGYGNISRARNEGARASHGDLILFCDADCMVGPDVVAELAQEVLKPGVSLAWGRSMPYDSPDHGMLWAIGNLFMHRTWTTGRGIMVRREVWEAVGGYQEDCDPVVACREDRGFGHDVAAMFGVPAISFRTDVIIGTSMRRERVEGYLAKMFGAPVWTRPAVR